MLHLLVFSVAVAFAGLHAVAGTRNVDESVVFLVGSDTCVHDASGAKLFEGVGIGVELSASAHMSDSLKVAVLLFGVKRLCA